MKQTPPQLNWMPRTRLLSAEQVAAKINRPKETFHRKEKRQQLEALGFPKPVLDRQHGSPPRWDEKAIDRWLDSFMETHLQEGQRVQVTIDRFDMEQRLAERAGALTL